MKKNAKIKETLLGLWFGISLFLLTGEPTDETSLLSFLIYYGIVLGNLAACVGVLNAHERKLKKQNDVNADTGNRRRISSGAE